MIRINKAAPIAILALVATLGVAEPAFAEGGVGGMADRLREQLGAFGSLIAAAAFVLGLGLGASGLMKFRQHSDNPNAVPISQPLVRLVVAAMLIALPSVLGVGIGTFFEDDAPTTTIEGEGLGVIEAK